MRRTPTEHDGRTALASDQPDAGFTLVEVVVALGLLGIIATATLGFFISGVRTSTELQRRQVAVALANAAVEDARRLPAALQSTTSGATTTTWPLLVRGRTQSSVTAQWASAPASVTAITFPSYDPGASASSAPLAPLSSSSTVGSATYSTSVVIGTCYRQRSALGTQDRPCDLAGRARTATPPAGYEELVRVSATTTWGTATQCSGASCAYTATVLVDTATDPLWNTSGGRAVDDVASAARGTTVQLDVLANDTMIPSTTSPVTVVSVPTGMTATADATGRISLTVPAGAATGQVTLTYRVRDAYGATSNTASVRVTVTT